MVNPTKGEKVKQELRAPKKPKRSAKSRMKISDTEEVETGDSVTLTTTTLLAYFIIHMYDL